MLGELVQEMLLALVHAERRTEPLWRSHFDAWLREPIAAVAQALINLQRADDRAGLAEEKLQPGELQALDAIVRDMAAYMRSRYRPGEFARVGQTKTHGLVRGELTIRPDIPPHMRQGIFSQVRTFPAWIRFSNAGPDSPPDIDDLGVMSMAVKLMDVPGPKLLDDEQHTQDLLAVSTPTFVTPDSVSNAQLQVQVRRRTGLFYFFDPRHSHLLDLVMQGLWSEVQSSPLECQYYSCVPYLLGQGRAMQYSFRPRLAGRSPVPSLPGRPSDHYLREAMIETLSGRDVAFDLLIQVQTHAFAMPIEHAGVRWPRNLSPYVPAATIHIPKQRFDSPAQLRFADALSFTPWHCIPEHRPLGNQNRARKRVYSELARLRFEMNRVQHVEPTGTETFDEAAQPQPPSAPKPAEIRAS